MRFSLLFLALCLGLTLTACRNGENAPSPAEAEPAAASPEAVGDHTEREFLPNQRFILRTVNGAAYTQDTAQPPFIEFGENQAVFGRVCNSFRGPAEVSGGVLTLKDAAVTKMACFDEGLTALERLFLRMLESGAKVSLDDSGLTLSQGGDTLVFEEIVPAVNGQPTRVQP